MTKDRQRAVFVCGLAAAWGLWVCAHAYARAATWRAPLLDHPLQNFMFWREALVRVSQAVGGVSLTALAAWQLGCHVIGRALPLPAGPIERGQFVLAVGAVALSTVLHGLSYVGAYRPFVVVGLLILLAVSRPVALRNSAKRAASFLRRGEFRRRAFGRRSGVDVAFAACIVLAFGFVLVAAFAPETEYDALWYHLWLPAQWLAAGHIVDIVSEYVALYPGGWELLNGAAMAAGGPVAAKLLHTACLPLVASAACLLGARVAPEASRPLTAALVATAPTMLWEGSTAYVDLALAWFVVLTVIALFRYHESDDRQWLLIAGVTAGGAMGVKHLGLVALTVTASMLIIRELKRRSVRTAAASITLFAAVAFALALPWYARAYASSGNPVFPDMYGVFGAKPDTRWNEGTQQALGRFKAKFGMGRTPRAIVSLPWNATTHAARFGGSFGPVFLVLIPLAAAGGGRRRLVPIAAGCGAYAAVWALPLGGFQLRFLVPLVPFFAVMAASGASLLLAHARVVHRMFALAPATAIVLLLLLNLPPFVAWHETEGGGSQGSLTHVLRATPAAVVVGAESDSSYRSRMVPAYRAWRAIDSRAPMNSRILTFVGGDHLYSNRARLWSDATMAGPVTWGAFAGDEDASLVAARRFGITHVLFDKLQFADRDFAGLAIASARMRECCFVPFHEDDRIVVYELNSEGVARQRSVGKRTTDDH